MKSRSLALSVLTALLAGFSSETTSTHNSAGANSTQVQQENEVNATDQEEKNRIRADAMRYLGACLRDDR